MRRLQTIIRRLRQELSASARAHGFALCSLFALDPAAITLSMIRSGKAGDVSALQRLARKAGDSRILGLLAARAIKENKAVPFESMGAMRTSWKPLDMQERERELDELAQLDRTLQRAAVLATIEQLSRRRLPTLSAEAAERAVTIACLDGGATNQAAAVLVAAAHHAAGWVATPPDADDVAEAQAEVEAAVRAEAILTGAAAAAAAHAEAGPALKKDEGSESAAAAAAAASEGPSPKRQKSDVSSGGGGGVAAAAVAAAAVRRPRQRARVLMRRRRRRRPRASSLARSRSM